ncbi:Uncharacterized protein HZ326_29532 [Fusarium oxysporum f. sp. albedinis]|nr:Uncharacterized protein HZ326_29532 [Fusarium oxysporum f. sp. albedinis]
MGYIEPHLYTGLLAAIVWWARLFFLEAAFENQPLDRDEVGVEAVLAFQEQHTSWMCMGTHTVMSTIIGWMAYGKGYRQKMGGQPSIRWSEDGEGLFHMGEHISVEDFTRTLLFYSRSSPAPVRRLPPVNCLIPQRPFYLRRKI